MLKFPTSINGRKSWGSQLQLPALLFILSLAPRVQGYGGSVPASLGTDFLVGVGGDDQAWMNASRSANNSCWDWVYRYFTAGWETWWPGGGGNVANFTNESYGNNYLPVVTYYELVGLTPVGETLPDLQTKLQSTATMGTFFSNYRLLLQQSRIGAASKPTVFHIEPDFWGTMHKSVIAASNNPANIPVSVTGAVGITECSSFPNNLVGFSMCLRRMKEIHYPEAELTIHVSVWANWDLMHCNCTQANIDADIAKYGPFFNALQNLGGPLTVTTWDTFSVDPDDRDADLWWLNPPWGGPNDRWLDPAAVSIGGARGNFTRMRYIYNGISNGLNRRYFLWQIPLGNTYYKTVNNSLSHYRDNLVQHFFPPVSTYTGCFDSGSNIGQLVANGGIGLLFGAGAAEPTDYDDGNADGITNPASSTAGVACCGNAWGVVNSTYADDDGGYLRLGLGAVCTAGDYILAGCASPTVSPTVTRTETPGGPTKTPTPTVSATATFSPTMCSIMFNNCNTINANGTWSGGNAVRTIVSSAPVGAITEGGSAVSIRINTGATWQDNFAVLTGFTPNPLQGWQRLKMDIYFGAGILGAGWHQLNLYADPGYSQLSTDAPNVVAGANSLTFNLFNAGVTLLPSQTLNDIFFVINTDIAGTGSLFIDNIRLESDVCPPTATATATRSGTRTFSPTISPSGTPSWTPSLTATPTASSSATWSPTRTWSGTSTISPTSSPTGTFSFTVTPSITPTATGTATSSVTPSSTQSFTGTATATRTPTATFTVTPTSSPTATASSSPTSSATRTATPTLTATATSSFTSTPTGTYSSSPTPSATRTWTPTWTPTFTPSNTATASPTATSSATRTATATASSTLTASSTFTASSSASDSPTASATRTPTSSFSETSTPTATRTWTPTWTPTFTPTATATASHTPTPSATRTATLTASSTATASATLTASASVSDSPTASGSTTASPTLTATATPSATRTATSSFSATSTPTATRTWTPTWTPTFTPSNTGTASPTATPSATRTVTSTASSSSTASATLTASASVSDSPTPSASPTASSSVTPTATQTTPASRTDTPTDSATLTVSASPTDSGTPTSTPAGTLTFTATASPSATRSPTPTLTATRTASATATRTSTRTETFTPSVSATQTRTPTVTATRTATRTASPSATRTRTPTATSTRTRTPTFTYTSSPTRSRTVTYTPTRTSSPSRTPSASSTVSVTVSPTPPGTFTMSDTLTVSASQTGTETPSLTDSPTDTATFTETPTATETETFTETSADSPTETETGTETPTLADSATQTPTESPTDSPTDSPSRTASPTRTSTATPSRSPSPSRTSTASPTRTATPTVTLTATGTGTSSVSPTITRTATPSFSRTWTPSSTATPTVTPTATGTRTITGTATTTPSPAADAAIFPANGVFAGATTFSYAVSISGPSSVTELSILFPSGWSAPVSFTSAAGGTVTWNVASGILHVAYSTALASGQTDLITFTISPPASWSSATFLSYLNGLPGMLTSVSAGGSQTVSHSTVTTTASPTATAGELRILGQAMVPNPVIGDELSLYIKLSAPATRINLRIFSDSGRKIRDTNLYPDPTMWLAYERFQAIGRQDALGTPLANGIYQYVVDVYQGDKVMDRRTGSFFVLH